MANQYHIIRQLIDFWEAYEHENPVEQTLNGFSTWLQDKVREDVVSANKAGSVYRGDQRPESVRYIEELDPGTRFLEYILRIARFEEFYFRKYLAGLPVNTRLEYLFLVTIDKLGRAKKTDPINIHMIEYSTGMDTIGRLIRNDLIRELPDKNDKRAKQLTLTGQGTKILKAANKRINEMRHMFLASISPNKWKKAIAVLNEIDDVHSSVYQHHFDKPHAELSNLMDSLKHLHR